MTEPQLNPTILAVKLALLPFTDDPAPFLASLETAAQDFSDATQVHRALRDLTHIMSGLIRQHSDVSVIRVLQAVESHLGAHLSSNAALNSEQQQAVIAMHTQVRAALTEHHLYQTMVYAIELRGWQRVTACYLLRAAHGLLLTARRHLQGTHTPDYPLQSLKQALTALHMALSEWVNNTHPMPQVQALLKAIARLFT